PYGQPPYGQPLAGPPTPPSAGAPGERPSGG
ncbi:MAG: hypothetical protein JWR66_3320, partial [Modestobacter sp.]|nr:hypothetical protein [Modestobacter sp.]